MKYEKHTADPDGWSNWVQPEMNGYKLCCCDCGLVHKMEFRAIEKIGPTRGKEWSGRPLDRRRYRVEFRVRRDNRATGQVRRHQANL